MARCAALYFLEKHRRQTALAALPETRVEGAFLDGNKADRREQ
jgi:hypothetical protein